MEKRQFNGGMRMQVNYTNAARRWGEGFSMLQTGAMLLEDVIGRYADAVSAEWDMALDGGKPVYTLILRGFGKERKTTFTPEQLASRTYLLAAMHHLWGDLLEDLSDAQHRKVQGLVHALED